MYHVVCHSDYNPHQVGGAVGAKQVAHESVSLCSCLDHLVVFLRCVCIGLAFAVMILIQTNSSAHAKLWLILFLLEMRDADV